MSVTKPARRQVATAANASAPTPSAAPPAPDASPPSAAEAEADLPLVLRLPDKQQQSFTDSAAFVAAALLAIGRMTTLDRLYGFWEHNLDSLRQLRGRAHGERPFNAIMTTLKARARSLQTATTALPRLQQPSYRPFHGRRKRARASACYPEGKAHTRQVASGIRRHPALPHLRSPPGTGAPPEVRPEPRHEPQGLG